MSVKDLQEGLKMTKHGLDKWTIKAHRQLGNVRLTVKDNNVTMFTTCLDLSVGVTYPCQSDNSGVICIDHADMLRYTKGMNKKSNISITINNGIATLESAGTVLNMSCQMEDVMPPEEKLDVTDMFALSPIDITDMKRVLSFVSEEQTRPAIRNVNITMTGLDAMNGYIAMRVARDINIGKPVALPQEAAKVVTTLLKSADVEVTDYTVTFTDNNIRVMSRLGLYNDYRTMYSQAVDRGGSRITVSRQEMLDALTLFKGLDTMAIIPDGDKLRLEAVDGNIKMTVKANCESDTVMQGFNPEYLQTVITAVADNHVTIRQIGALKTATVDQNGQIILISPIRLNNAQSDEKSA
jgi:DNA polymerase III sliding clamp (beta) subunit (PCNA family)